MGPKFSISLTGQSGQIYYNTSSGSTGPFVGYELNSSSVNRNLFHRDSNGHVCTVTQAQMVPPNYECSNGTYVLYDKDISSGVSELGIAKLNTIDNEDSAKWNYNLNGKNEWCLTTNTNKCMSFNSDNNQTAVTVQTSTGDFVTFVDTSESTNSSVTDNPINPISVESNGSRWNNVNYVPVFNPIN